MELKEPTEESEELRPRLVLPDSPVLRMPTSPVLIPVSGEILKKIDATRDFASGKRGGKEGQGTVLTGLSANQMGYRESFFVALIGEELKVFINPKIIWQSDDQEKFWEGCLSLQFGKWLICGEVLRPVSIGVEAYTEDGKQFRQHYNRQWARRFLHERDHLLGKNLVDCITDDQNLHLVRLDEVEDYRKNWENWCRKCPRELYDLVISDNAAAVLYAKDHFPS